MSMVSHLNKEYMTTNCPACGHEIDVCEADLNGTMPDGCKEYECSCPECGQGFYSSEAY